MVALVRGVHGLRGAVRVEVLTDRPEERFTPGTVLHREGSDAPLTIAVAIEGAKNPHIDATRAVECLMLAAWAEGVGSCWVGGIDRDAALEEGAHGGGVSD